MIIAIDGPSASGKGTLARRLAAHYGLRHLDTGALYRAVGLGVLLAGGDPADAQTAAQAASALDLSLLENPLLRSEAAGRAASQVAVHPAVRAALLDFQRRFAASGPGAVLDGRDIGTVICPDADAKIFLSASARVRARRRAAELAARGEAADAAQIEADLEARDARDTRRAAAPLKAAADALLLDTSDLDIDAAVHAAIALIDKRLGMSRAGL